MLLYGHRSEVAIRDGNGRGWGVGRVSGWSAKSDPRKTEEAMDLRQNNNHVKIVGTSLLRSN